LGTNNGLSLQLTGQNFAQVGLDSSFLLEYGRLTRIFSKAKLSHSN